LTQRTNLTAELREPAAAPAAMALPSRNREADELTAAWPPVPEERRLFCNRTLNLRGIRAVGYDMDYTLVHYHHRAWEGRAYAHLQQRLVAQGWPVADLAFEPDRVMRGLIIDKQLGNILKVNRFGYVKASMHGTRPLPLDDQRKAYADTLVDLADTSRWLLLNTLFEISEGCMYAQLVDLLDARQLPGVLGYETLYKKVRHTLDRAHIEGELKAEILANPEMYVDLDPLAPLALLDQKESGKKVILITNSEWSYTDAMMRYAFDRFLPAGMTWRDLFSLVVVSSRKPAFFQQNNAMFEVVGDGPLLRPLDHPPKEGGVYFGGHAALVEKALGVDGDQILYVGDHMFGDVRQSKKLSQWRTALIVREIEEELQAVAAWRRDQQRIDQLMAEKERLEFAFSQYRLTRQRQRAGYGPTATVPTDDLGDRMNTLRDRLVELDNEIAPLVARGGQLHNSHWGLMMRAGNDKSLFARQVEGHADVYTSRVSNFVYETPFVYLRSLRGSLPHDREP
jgi:HAD superfamily 5'-nucleotidase-like hydrolase